MVWYQQTVQWVGVKSQEIFASREKKREEKKDRAKVAFQVGMYLAWDIMTNGGGNQERL